MVNQKKGIDLLDEIIRHDPNYAIVAHYYKAHLLIKSKGNKKDVLRELRKVEELLKLKQLQNNSDSILVKMISEYYSENATKSFTPTEGFDNQMTQMNEVYQTILSNIYTIIGHRVNKTELQGVMEYPDKANFLYKELHRLGILKPNHLQKLRALSSDVRIILRDQYGFDTQSIINKLKTLTDGQIVKDEDFRNIVANAEDFWECVTEEELRDNYILINKESLKHTRFENPNILKELERQCMSTNAQRKLFINSIDNQYLYLPPENVTEDDIKENKFLIYRKHDLKSNTLQLINDIDLAKEMRIGKLKGRH